MSKPVTDEPADLPLSEVDRAELDRRLEHFYKNPDEGSPGLEVIERIRQRARAK